MFAIRLASPAAHRRALGCLLAAALSLHAVAHATTEGEVTTLPPDTTTSVDLREQQREAERAAARRRAEIAASLPGAAEREAIVPEILLLQREVLPRLVVVSSHPAGATQTWRLKSVTPPPVYAERAITYLLLAGFSTTPPCAGEEWSGTHGQSRVAVRVEARNVVVTLVRKDAACAGAAH